MLLTSAVLITFVFAQAYNPRKPTAYTAGSGMEENPRTKQIPRIIFNSDGGSGVLFAFEPPITPKQLCRVVDALEGTQVDVFVQCINFSDDHLVYGTKVAEIYGKHLTEFENPNFRRWAHNVLGLLQQGLDPLNILAKRSQQLGMQFWPSLRMNDIHKDWVERWPSMRSDWEKQHPHVRIGSAVPDRYLGSSPAHPAFAELVENLVMGNGLALQRRRGVRGALRSQSRRRIST